MTHAPAFSRAEHKPEKLTLMSPLTVRITEALSHDISGLADLHGMEKSEYIRFLVLQDKAEQHRIWVARNGLFSSHAAAATTTSDDIV